MRQEVAASLEEQGALQVDQLLSTPFTTGMSTGLLRAMHCYVQVRLLPLNTQTHSQQAMYHDGCLYK